MKQKYNNPWLRLLFILVGVPPLAYLAIWSVLIAAGGGNGEIFVILGACFVVFVVFKAIQKHREIKNDQFTHAKN